MTTPTTPPTTHSPMPWKVGTPHGVHAIQDRNGVIVAAIYDLDEEDANAALIVSACNAHAKLVEALRDAETLIASKGGYLATQAFETDRRVLASIRSALAAAGEQA